ncbi:hypothetical protein RCL1_008403 [Eukaryota sp. TZLM3-RCL]
MSDDWVLNTVLDRLNLKYDSIRAYFQVRQKFYDRIEQLKSLEERQRRCHRFFKLLSHTTDKIANNLKDPLSNHPIRNEVLARSDMTPHAAILSLIKEEQAKQANLKSQIIRLEEDIKAANENKSTKTVELDRQNSFKQDLSSLCSRHQIEVVPRMEHGQLRGKAKQLPEALFHFYAQIFPLSHVLSIKIENSPLLIVFNNVKDSIFRNYHELSIYVSLKQSSEITLVFTYFTEINCVGFSFLASGKLFPKTSSVPNYSPLAFNSFLALKLFSLDFPNLVSSDSEILGSKVPKNSLFFRDLSVPSNFPYRFSKSLNIYANILPGLDLLPNLGFFLSDALSDQINFTNLIEIELMSVQNSFSLFPNFQFFFRNFTVLSGYFEL